MTAVSEPSSALAANGISDISGTWAYPTYDAAGNMTQLPKAGDETTSLSAKYDAWNRLKEVSEEVAPGYWLVRSTYWYDGLGRRISNNPAGGTVDYFYNDTMSDHHAIVRAERKQTI